MVLYYFVTLLLYYYGTLVLWCTGTAEDAAAAAAAREQGGDALARLDEFRRKPRTNSHNPNDVGRIVQVNRL